MDSDPPGGILTVHDPPDHTQSPCRTGVDFPCSWSGASVHFARRLGASSTPCLSLARMARLVQGCIAMSRSLVFAAFICLCLSTLAFAQEKKPEYYQERLEFDPNTGKWTTLAPPIPGTEEGDLALARLLLAQGEYKKARKAF